MLSQKLRIVCISDTHNQTPHLPPGDILIHAGDLCQQGTPEEMRKIIKWLEAASFRLKIVIAGNHDECLDPTSSRNDSDAARKECVALIEMLQSSSTIQYFQHETKILTLKNHDDTEVRLKVFGSPFTPGRRSRAFGYPPETAPKVWDAISLDADIVVTHTPAKYHLDESRAVGSVGCPQLREALWRVRPKLFVCGHIHEGRGAQIVEWDLQTPNVKFKEVSATDIPDQTSSTKKAFRIDVSSSSTSPLRNDAAQGDLVPCSRRIKLQGSDIDDDDLPKSPGLAKRGVGHVTGEVNGDQEAILGREGRVETLMVNGSYVPARNLSRSHRQCRSFNKPVLVDLDFRSDPGPEEWYATTLLLSLNDPNDSTSC
jgi:calcineurin-like phosphoesterase family protein